MKGFSVDLQFGNLLQLGRVCGLEGRSYCEALFVIQVRTEQGQDEAPLVGRGNGQRGEDERGRQRAAGLDRAYLRGEEALRVRSPEPAWEMGVLLSLR